MITGTVLRVIEFHAKWCGPCQRIWEDVDILAAMYPQIFLERRDLDENDEDADFFKIESIPTFVFLVGDEEIDRVVGANLDSVRETIERHLHSLEEMKDVGHYRTSSENTG